MTEKMIAELREVVRKRQNAKSLAQVLRANQQAADYLTEHHSAIEAAVRDAGRWRASHFADAPIVTVTGEQLRKGIRPGDYAVPWDWPITPKTKIRLIAIAQHSGREG